MKIWLINHYAVPPQYYPLARPSLFAKNLIRNGHEVTIIAASTVHNSDENLACGSGKIRRMVDDGIPYVLVKCSDYQGNGLRRVINILEFANKLPGVLNSLEKPDAIVATSFDPLSCLAGIKYAKKHGIRAIAEIADLWPETLVVYAGVSPGNPAVRFLRHIEKEIYQSADSIVFTMKGAYDYIVEQGWEKDIPREKVHYINNGVDLEQFACNRERYQIVDEDLDDEETFKAVYVGSIRKVNDLSVLVDAAKKIRDRRIRILVWGAGDELEALRQRVKDECLENIVFKGRVEKKYIPYITSRADLNIVHGGESSILRFGISANKIFDCLAAGKPILVTLHAAYNPVIESGAGIEVAEKTPQGIADAIESFAQMDHDEKERLGAVAAECAKQYDFRVLTEKLMDVICSV